MNGGHTPGYLLAQIESALCRAFPSKTKLAMMLQHQFSKNLEEVARGENFTEIVYKVVQYFQTRNRLKKLINKALKENPDNPELKAINEKYKITISLVKLLRPLEKNFINQMQQAYQACCPDKLWEDWEDELPDSLAEIIGNLDDIPQPNDDEKPIVKFVARLFKTGDIPEKTAKELKQWITENANNPSDVLSPSNSDSQNHQQQNLDAQPYLLVKLYSSKQYQQQRQPSYLVSAWFIPDINNYNYLLNHENCKFLQTPPADGESEQDIFYIEDLPKLIDFFLDQLIHYSREYYRQPILVFFLPYQLLLNYEIEKFEIQDDDNLPIPIGSEYCVIFRSVKRLKNYRHQSQWLRKWKHIQNSNKTICLNNFAFSNFEDWQELYAYVKQNDAIGLKLHQPPCDQILKVIDRTAIPVTLWLRQNNFTTINCQQALEQLLNCQINQLPEKVKEQRLQAFPKGNKQEHIGHHLALLWEDPDLLPPQINYTTL
ncbi:effector-associated domain EAD1-containing protein [Moorena sp. SIO3H5]|uniref:VMAP-C domain-containing protein n=1 Tax=Moorena sp. SIO3H5 TaxID=2607834 RepID=UPI0013BE77EE|nr:effector-associated domain EAD1-containing protein [Moorena sp. SIO3H5]NEO70411.1 hypothetical protein [Moorena sp. SIO3H5]